MRRTFIGTLCMALLLTACSFAVEVDGVSHTVRVRPLVSTATDASLPTLTPTPTLTVTPTPRPTSTPISTATPFPDSPTPTRETTLPTPTATTTPRPTTEPKACLVKLSVSFAVKLRDRPALSGKQIGVLPPGSLLYVDEFRPADGYLWAHIYDGWFAAREGQTWWITPVSGYEDFCPDVPGWPVGETPLPPIVRGAPGIWVGPGANRDELIAFGETLKAAGYQPAATIYGDSVTASILLSRGWLVLRRAITAPDCPDTRVPPDASASAFISRVVAETGISAQIIIGANECTWPSAEWTARWIAASGRYAAALGVRALVPVVWNPGVPELDWVSVLRSAYLSAPIALLWGMNVYPARVNTSLMAVDDWTRYTTWRWRIYRPMLKPVPMVVTEFARGDGNEEPDFADIRSWWLAVRTSVHAATAWYVAGSGGLGHWPRANMLGKLSRLGMALQ